MKLQYIIFLIETIVNYRFIPTDDSGCFYFLVFKLLLFVSIAFIKNYISYVQTVYGVVLMTP